MQEVSNEYYVVENWPIVYILNKNRKNNAYVGETMDWTLRYSSHLKDSEKKTLRCVVIISSRLFNKSITLDLESDLIRYMHADGKFNLLNGNGGMLNHSYPNRTEYSSTLFNEIWNDLMKKEIVKQSRETLSNSDIFKYSPYKSLSLDQKKNLLIIIDQLLSNKIKYTFIEGVAGSGKSVLAVFLFKLLSTPYDIENYKEFANEESELFLKIKKLKQKYRNAPTMALVISMSSFRHTMKKVFRSIHGLNSSMVIGPTDLARKRYDIIFVDEAHRLRRRINLTNYDAFDKASKALGFSRDDSTELKWICEQGEKVLFFYDPNQTIKPTDVTTDDFLKLKSRATSHIVSLYSQFRVKGGNDYVQFVDDLLNVRTGKLKKYADRKHDLRLYVGINSFVSDIQSLNKKYSLCRFVAGFGWKWQTNIKKSGKKASHDIEIGSKKFKWNAKTIDYIQIDKNAEQVGCIHTVQGYDLNYVGVIFGPEITFNKSTNEIVIIPEKYFDRNGKISIVDPEELKKYIINIYRTIMLRGILGCYVYAMDPELRDYLRKYIRAYP